jgi:preprotein translocase subunit SecG
VETLVLVVHILVALGMIGLILIQQGKGAEAGASFGGGASGTVFGAAGSANFMTRTTAILTTIFFVTSLTLAIIAKKQSEALLSLPSSATPAVVATPVPTSTALKKAPDLQVGTPITANAPSNPATVPVD